MSAQIWLASIVAIVFMLLLFAVAAMLTFGQQRKVSTEAMFIFRALLALTGGAFGVLLPGFLDVSLDAPGLAIRAGAGFALAIVIYRLNPPSLFDSMHAQAGDN